ncbi:MAG: helix-turn-helix domain-containing protein, partial [Bacteroidota bacterium]
IYNPPLRERKEDIPTLAHFFLDRYSKKIGKHFSGLSKRTLNQLNHYHFPGNIRELENLIERAVITERGPLLKPGSWMPKVKPNSANLNDYFGSFEEMQRRYLLQVLESTKWRVSGDKGAAKILDMNAKTLFAKMKKLGIERS